MLRFYHEQFSRAFAVAYIDQLWVGETIKLIAINRKTGYLGTVTTEVGNAAAGAVREGCPRRVIGGSAGRIAISMTACI